MSSKLAATVLAFKGYEGGSKRKVCAKHKAMAVELLQEYKPDVVGRLLAISVSALSRWQAEFRAEGVQQQEELPTFVSLASLAEPASDASQVGLWLSWLFRELVACCK